VQDSFEHQTSKASHPINSYPNQVIQKPKLEDFRYGFSLCGACSIMDSPGCPNFAPKLGLLHAPKPKIMF